MATSYGTRTEADAYFSARGIEAWAAASESARDAALIRGTAYLESRYAGRWKGKKTSADQSLGWPRSGATDGDGYEIADDAIPSQVEHAAYEAALRDLTNPGALYGEGATSQRVVRRRVGDIETQFSDDGGLSPAEVASSILDGLLSGLLKSLGSMSTGFLARA